jgi:hypothetical protein
MNSAHIPFSYTNETRLFIKEVNDKQKLKFILTVPPGITSSAGE